ncbi:hypothetical protein T440DRAFT_29338 [Plenodomus tracheiphilus IPT5]|uniref:Heterokaryon incompatibility domain-containing protein n=1 Tax=Plenodomus tracheiphilus IPT5 TaxID=1408161 RepID=A0A6A7BE95_9PLEO|nr:hypothetical protein T440DRAFT_29338 [Plenodomus tracheiphilus IPT5]
MLLSGKRMAMHQNLFRLLRVVYRGLASSFPPNSEQIEQTPHNTRAQRRTFEEINLREFFKNSRSFSRLNGYARHYIRSTKISNASEAFWMDALCIDQFNIGEKNHQMAQMGLVSSRARRVQLWLGLTSRCLLTLLQIL